ncbi:hypothetical protein JHK87_000763 [Glycine soja]|nr:hypothetical protein JHK87_000763 [Glycine soja]
MTIPNDEHCWIGKLQEPPSWVTLFTQGLLTSVSNKGVGFPSVLDDATSNKSFGHYVRVLVDIDLATKLHD